MKDLVRSIGFTHFLYLRLLLLLYFIKKSSRSVNSKGANELVQKYFVSGLCVYSSLDGWLLKGIVLHERKGILCFMGVNDQLSGLETIILFVSMKAYIIDGSFIFWFLFIFTSNL